MTETVQAPYSLMCSGCYTPCSGHDAHVVPGWNEAMSKVITCYRCGNCWRNALSILSAQLVGDDPAIVASFWDFLERRGFTDIQPLREKDVTDQQLLALKVVDAIEAGRLVLEP